MMSPRADSNRRGALRRLTGRLATAAAAVVLAGSLAALAVASGPGATVGAAHSTALGANVAVSSKGRTLYVLTPETAHHLLCASAECLRFWPPLTVASRSVRLKDGPGIHGRLGLLRRSNGMLQVTLNAMPVYRYSGDQGKAEDNGQGIEGFGGTWHAVLATGRADTSAAPGMGTGSTRRLDAREQPHPRGRACRAIPATSTDPLRAGGPAEAARARRPAPPHAGGAESRPAGRFGALLRRRRDYG